MQFLSLSEQLTRISQCLFTHNSLFQNLPKDKACFCGGHLKFSQMMAAVEALLCDETEAEDQGRQSRLFFPGGGLGNLPNALQTLGLTLFQQNAAPKTTIAPKTTATTAAPITALKAKAELLENNINSLKEAKAAVEKAIADARRRKRAAATTCSGFISLVKKRKTFLIQKEA